MFPLSYSSKNLSPHCTGGRQSAMETALLLLRPERRIVSYTMPSNHTLKRVLPNDSYLLSDLELDEKQEVDVMLSFCLDPFQHDSHQRVSPVQKWTAKASLRLKNKNTFKLLKHLHACSHSSMLKTGSAVDSTKKSVAMWQKVDSQESDEK